MPENEFYRQTIVIDVQGDTETKAKLKAMDNYLETNRKKANALNKARVSPKVTLSDHISRPLANIQTKIKKLGGVHKITLRAVDQTKNILGRITSAISSPLALLGGGAGAAALIGYPMKLAGEMEQANIAMETMLGSRAKALSFQRQLTAYAIKTPFEMPQLREATTRLLAFGFASKQILPMLTAIGDASSGLGLGAEGLDRISTALGQMKAKAKVSADEMMQLTEAGVPAWDILAKKMHTSTAAVMEMSQKGLIPANKAIDMLLSGMEERFPHMMDRQSKSLFGLASTIKDFFNLQVFTAFGEGIRQKVAPELEKFTDKLTGNQKTGDKMAKTFQNLGRTVGTVLTDGFERAYKWFEKISGDSAFKKLDFVGKLSYMLTSGISEITPIAIKIGTELGFALAKGLVAGASKAAAEDPKAAALMGLAMPGPWQVKLGAAAALGITSEGVNIATHNIPKIQAQAKKVKPFNWLPYKRQPVGPSPWDQFWSDFSYHPPTDTVTKHATGGIFSKPHLGLIAEKGREGLVPLASSQRHRALSIWSQIGNQLGVAPMQPSFSGSGHGLNISIDKVNVDFGGNQIDENAIAMKIGWQILNAMKKSLENRD